LQFPTNLPCRHIYLVQYFSYYLYNQVGFRMDLRAKKPGPEANSDRRKAELGNQEQICRASPVSHYGQLLIMFGQLLRNTTL
jgi:hypothetical protein